MSYETFNEQPASLENVFITKVYGWMTAGLMISAILAFASSTIPSLRAVVFGSKGVLIGLFLAELALVWILSAAVRSLPVMAAAIMFIIYSALNGLTLGFIFLVYTASSIASAFVVTAGVFGVMSVYGYLTKRDLTSIGNMCLMALVGLIIASVVNWFWSNSMLYWIVTYAGVFIFIGLTAYDTQKIKNLDVSGQDVYSQAGQKAAIIGALVLYLDFINLFLFILRIVGRRK